MPRNPANLAGHVCTAVAPALRPTRQPSGYLPIIVLVRGIVERLRAQSTLMSQSEIYPRTGEDGGEYLER